MQSLSVRLTILAGVALSAVVLAAARQSEQPRITITGVPSEPVTAGTCTSSTFGYLDLKGKTANFTDAELGQMILPALRQGYVITIYPPTKRGVFVNQECHSAQK